MTVTPANAGLVNPQSGTYNAGETVTIQISANTDYTFTGWSGSWNSSDEQITLTMDSDKSLTANFSFLDDDNDGIGNSVDSCGGTSDGTAVDSQGCAITILYIDTNGITVKANSDAQVGQQSTINSQSYTVVDRTTLLSKINAGENVENVVTTLVTNFHSLFLNKTGFNQDISSWDVSNVTSMSSMFQGATSFNQNISSWDVSNVQDFSYMFSGATSFNQPLANWDTSNATNLDFMFAYNSGFNKDISSWNLNVSQQFYMMFHGSPNYSQSGTYWGVSWDRLVVNTDVLSATSGGYVSLNSTSGGYVSLSGVGNFVYPLNPYIGGTYARGYGNPYMLANPNTGYSFVKWTASNPPISSIRGAESNDITVGPELTADQTLTANFLINTHTLTATSSNGGSVFVNGVHSLNANSTFNYGEQVTLTVEPIIGWYFANWSGASSSTSSEITITMNSDTAITGNFEQYSSSYSLTVSVEAGGSVQWVSRINNGTNTGGQTQITNGYYPAEEITLTAVPESGNSFLEWECNSGCSGNTFGSNETLVLTIGTSDINITAKFQ